MRFLWPWRRTYPDERIALLAYEAVAADPLLPDHSRVTLTCNKGVIYLTGRVSKQWKKDRIEADIRAALHTADLNYKHIVNYLYVP